MTTGHIPRICRVAVGYIAHVQLCSILDVALVTLVLPWTTTSKVVSPMRRCGWVLSLCKLQEHFRCSATELRADCRPDGNRTRAARLIRVCKLLKLEHSLTHHVNGGNPKSQQAMPPNMVSRYFQQKCRQCLAASPF